MRGRAHRYVRQTDNKQTDGTHSKQKRTAHSQHSIRRTHIQHMDGLQTVNTVTYSTKTTLEKKGIQQQTDRAHVTYRRTAQSQHTEGRRTHYCQHTDITRNGQLRKYSEERQYTDRQQTANKLIDCTRTTQVKEGTYITQICTVNQHTYATAHRQHTRRRTTQIQHTVGRLTAITLTDCTKTKH